MPNGSHAAAAAAAAGSSSIRLDTLKPQVVPELHGAAENPRTARRRAVAAAAAAFATRERGVVERRQALAAPRRYRTWPGS